MTKYVKGDKGDPVSDPVLNPVLQAYMSTH